MPSWTPSLGRPRPRAVTSVGKRLPTPHAYGGCHSLTEPAFFIRLEPPWFSPLEGLVQPSPGTSRVCFLLFLQSLAGLSAEFSCRRTGETQSVCLFPQRDCETSVVLSKERGALTRKAIRGVGVGVGLLYSSSDEHQPRAFLLEEALGQPPPKVLSAVSPMMSASLLHFDPGGLASEL